MGGKGEMRVLDNVIRINLLNFNTLIFPVTGDAGCEIAI